MAVGKSTAFLRTVERPGGAARDVNNDGVIAGEIFSITPDESKRSAVVWSQLYSGPTLLPALAGFDLADYSKASGINNAGYVVGSIKRQDAPLERRAVLWVPDPSDPSGSGYMACSLHPTHADYSSVSAVSEPVGDKVKVLGLVRFPDGPTTVTVWTLSATLLGGCPDVTGTFEQIPELARFPLNDINGWGDIVGQDISHGGARPVVWIQGTLVELPSLKGNHGSAQGINNDGRMVGSSSAGGGSHAVLWTSNSNQ